VQLPEISSPAKRGSAEIGSTPFIVPIGCVLDVRTVLFWGMCLIRPTSGKLAQTFFALDASFGSERTQVSQQKKDRACKS
jgi:hypothetical protein